MLKIVSCFYCFITLNRLIEGHNLNKNYLQLNLYSLLTVFNRFRYNKQGNPVSTKMVDFQIVRLGHPLDDLLYFFYSSTLPELREKHLKGLFRHYFDILCSKLDMLEVEINFTWEEFLAEYKKRSIMFGLMAGM